MVWFLGMLTGGLAVLAGMAYIAERWDKRRAAEELAKWKPSVVHEKFTGYDEKAAVAGARTAKVAAQQRMRTEHRRVTVIAKRVEKRESDARGAGRRVEPFRKVVGS